MIRKTVECFKYCLMGHTSTSMEDSSVERDLMNCGGLLKRLHGRILVCCLSNILVKKVAVFCPCLKSLPEAKVKTFGLIPLAEDISE